MVLDCSCFSVLAQCLWRSYFGHQCVLEGWEPSWRTAPKTCLQSAKKHFHAEVSLRRVIPVLTAAFQLFWWTEIPAAVGSEHLILSVMEEELLGNFWSFLITSNSCESEAGKVCHQLEASVTAPQNWFKTVGTSFSEFGPTWFWKSHSLGKPSACGIFFASAPPLSIFCF